MFTESDNTIRRLQHERNIWRGIAIGLAATLVLLIGLGGVGSLLLVKRSQAARMEAEAQRDLAERARLEARQGAEERKAKLP
jgi:hypothetical protein